MNKVFEKAKGKINLFLEITGKREDGYHNLETVMYAVDLFDGVTVEKTDIPGISLECIFDTESNNCKREDFAPLFGLDPEKNLAYRTAEKFLSRLGKTDCGVKITIEKRIPVCAGLAGGSTDAAAVLRALNTLFDTPFSLEELCEMGCQLGADIPFCVAGGLCLCRGIGEILTPIETEMEFHGIIALEKTKKPSTAAAYAMADAREASELRSADRMLSYINGNNLDGVCGEFFNVFEKACNYGGGASEIMRANGAAGVLLSGSGPSFFGIFDDEKKKAAATAALTKEGYSVYVF